MSQFNHLNDIPDTVTTCKSCNKRFSYYVDDISMYGGHDSDIIRCPWCGSSNGEVQGGDSISVSSSKIN